MRKGGWLFWFMPCTGFYFGCVDYIVLIMYFPISDDEFIVIYAVEGASEGWEKSITFMSRIREQAATVVKDSWRKLVDKTRQKDGPEIEM